MDRDEAFVLLGIEVTATRKQVNAAYRRKSKAMHPDTGGGSRDQTNLNEAKKLILDGMETSGRELTVLQERLPALERAVNSVIFHQQADKIKTHLIRKSASRLVRAKNVSAFVGLSLAIAAAFLQLNSSVSKQLPTEAPAVITSSEGKVIAPTKPSGLAAWIFDVPGMLGLYAGSFGLIFAWLKYRIDRLSNRIEEFNESLSTSSYCARELSWLIDPKQKVIDLQKIVEEGEYRRSKRRSALASELETPHLGRVLGLSLELTDSEKAPLVFKKAQEHGLIKKLGIDPNKNDFRDMYEVLVDLSKARRL